MPTDYQNKNNFLSIDPVTKVIYEVARPTIPVNFFKKVIFNGGLQSYISNNGFGDILDSEVTGANELQREILPSNTLIQFQNSGFLKGFVGIASDNDVIIDVYKAYCSLNGDYLDLFTLIYSFPLNSNGGQSIGFPNLFISGGQVVRLGVRSSIAKTNEVNIQGTFYII
ncbi:hypothetical protein [Flavobacterium sp.]|uniref:hypothetical protein n=1 Tax=Flavobacterium sp. TaxID=239 RepID=UPI00374DAC54